MLVVCRKWSELRPWVHRCAGLASSWGLACGVQAATWIRQARQGPGLHRALLLGWEARRGDPMGDAGPVTPLVKSLPPGSSSGASHRDTSSILVLVQL